MAGLVPSAKSPPLSVLQFPRGSSSQTLSSLKPFVVPPLTSRGQWCTNIAQSASKFSFVCCFPGQENYGEIIVAYVSLFQRSLFHIQCTVRRGLVTVCRWGSRASETWETTRTHAIHWQLKTIWMLGAQCCMSGLLSIDNQLPTLWFMKYFLTLNIRKFLFCPI